MHYISVLINGKCDVDIPYFMTDATPPLRIVSLCSEKTMTFASGYSKSPFDSKGLEYRGVRKNVRPIGAYACL